MKTLRESLLDTDFDLSDEDLGIERLLNSPYKEKYYSDNSYSWILRYKQQSNFLREFHKMVGVYGKPISATTAKKKAEQGRNVCVIADYGSKRENIWIVINSRIFNVFRDSDTPNGKGDFLFQTESWWMLPSFQSKNSKCFELSQNLCLAILDVFSSTFSTFPIKY